MKKKKKSKVIYEEDIYPSEFEKSVGALWVQAPWVKHPVFNMPCIVFGWWSADGIVVAMGHQSLQ